MCYSFVKFWPTYLLDSQANRRDWSRITDPAEIVISERRKQISGRLVREANLKQNVARAKDTILEELLQEMAENDNLEQQQPVADREMKRQMERLSKNLAVEKDKMRKDMTMKMSKAIDKEKARLQEVYRNKFEKRMAEIEREELEKSFLQISSPSVTVRHTGMYKLVLIKYPIYIK